MKRSRLFHLAVTACCLLAGGPVGARASLSVCEQAGTAAEQAHGLPSGLLLAIGRVESGRWDAVRNRLIPSPWAINAAGKGAWFETKDAAVQTVRTLQASGVRSIDTGCFQISLLHHPAAFTDLEQAFDPAANAAYAARFLINLFARTGSWESAVASYHSADPVRGFAYREQVFGTWLAPGRAPASVRAGLPPALASSDLATASLDSALAVGLEPIPRITAGVQVWIPMLAGTSPKIVAMPPPPVPVSPPRAQVRPEPPPARPPDG
ncbi:MAG: lytic transglycosylase domain-containing protein [Acetobacteraceae bacterium]|nr:lytic transglycosylase domain-containing protein [Acetobacteraceae bacterium]